MSQRTMVVNRKSYYMVRLCRTHRKSPGPASAEERRIERRNAIPAVATRSFLENGYAGTTMSSISAELGGSKATLRELFLVQGGAVRRHPRSTDGGFPRRPHLGAQSVGGAASGDRDLLHPLHAEGLQPAGDRDAPADRRRERPLARRWGRSSTTGVGRDSALLIAFLERHIAAGHLKPADPYLMKELLLSTGDGRAAAMCHARGRADRRTTDYRARGLHREHLLHALRKQD